MIPAGRPLRSLAFAAANSAGVRVRLILSATNARTMAACNAGKLPSSWEAARAYSALAFVWRTNGSCARAAKAACARSSETRIPMTASPNRVSVSSKVLSAAKAAACFTVGAFTGTGKMSGGVKIGVKLGSAGADAFVPLAAELATTGVSVAALELSPGTVAILAPASVRETVATLRAALHGGRNGGFGSFSVHGGRLS